MRHLVVVPAFNEQASLDATLTALDALPPEYDVLVVDDGSTDATGLLARDFARRSLHAISVVSLPMNCGIGAAVQTGYRFAKQRGNYRYVVQCDADGQHDPRCIPQLVEQCDRQQLDICIGSRFLARPQSETGGFRSTLPRRAGIRILRGVVFAVTGRWIFDPTSGLRCVGPRAWNLFCSRYPDDFPEPQSLVSCVRSGLRLGEVPVRMHPRRSGRSSISTMASAYYIFKVSLSLLFERLIISETAP